MITLLKPPSELKAPITLAGSKSISNRLLILQQVMGTQLHITNLSTSEDTQLLQDALTQIRATNKANIDVHHAGTDLRFLTALLSVTPGEWTLTGSTRLQERPLAPLIQALRQLGADIRCLQREGVAPLSITGKKLQGGQLEMDSSISSQFISALLLIAPALPNGLELKLSGETVSYPYIKMTLALLQQFGARVEQNGAIIRVSSASAPSFPPDFTVESDWSSASYWYSVCALGPGAEIELKHLSPQSEQADAVLPTLFEQLGVHSTFKNGSLFLKSTKAGLGSFSYDFTNCPDIAQTLAVTCFGLGIAANLTGLKTLKLKETDRITALKTELEKFGATVNITDDSIYISQTQNPEYRTNNFSEIVVNTYNDHRMAMSFAALALVNGQVWIDDETVVSKSYPAFWADLKSAGFSVNLQP